jgi:periplasmic mercuric ion binding protein
MKNIITLLLFSMLTISVSAQENNKNQKAVIKTALYCDHCAACETCGKNFKANLYKTKGLKSFELDEEKMIFTVYYNAEKTDLQTIKMAISKLGYDADEIKADTVAYQKLDDCCKKV